MTILNHAYHEENFIHLRIDLGTNTAILRIKLLSIPPYFEIVNLTGLDTEENRQIIQAYLNEKQII